LDFYSRSTSFEVFPSPAGGARIPRPYPSPYRRRRGGPGELRAPVVEVLEIVPPGAINKGGHPGAMLRARAVFWRGKDPPTLAPDRHPN
jgi:hypothetical protein